MENYESNHVSHLTAISYVWRSYLFEYYLHPEDASHWMLPPSHRLKLGPDYVLPGGKPAGLFNLLQGPLETGISKKLKSSLILKLSLSPLFLSYLKSNMVAKLIGLTSTIHLKYEHLLPSPLPPSCLEPLFSLFLIGLIPFPHVS